MPIRGMDKFHVVQFVIDDFLLAKYIISASNSCEKLLAEAT
jgi:hypothetical protein